MTVRQCDPSFNSEEKLWRRIETGNVDKAGKVKPNALRLQVSVVREKHGQKDRVPHEKWNGIAETEAARVCALSKEAVRFVCVDDADTQQSGHALIAMVAEPGVPVGQDAINGLRAELALSFQVILVPTTAV